MLELLEEGILTALEVELLEEGKGVVVLVAVGGVEVGEAVGLQR